MNILVTDYNNSGTDVCIIGTTLNPTEVEKGLKLKNQNFIEVYEIPANELQSYIYEPLFADLKFDNSVKILIENLTS